MASSMIKRVALLLLAGFAGRELYRRYRATLAVFSVHQQITKDNGGSDVDARVAAEALRAFRSNFARGVESGAQLTVVKDGRILVEVCGGATQDELLERYQLSVLFSSSKVIESLCVAKLVEANKLDYDARLVDVLGKQKFAHFQDLKVRDLMRYRAGAAIIEKPVTLSEAEAIFASKDLTENFVLENLSRDYQPADPRRTSYHAYTRGFIVALIMWKVDGRSMSEFVQQEIVAKLNNNNKKKANNVNVEFKYGCPPEWQARVARTFPSKHPIEIGLELLLHSSGFVEKFLHPGEAGTKSQLEKHYQDWLSPEEVKATVGMITSTRDPMRKSLILCTDVGLGAHFMANNERLRAIPMSSVTGISNATSMALILAELANDGGCLLTPDALQKALKHDSEPAPFDRFMGSHITYCHAGWGMDRFGPDWIGWGGAGGSVCVFNPKLKLSFAYIPNRLEGRVHKPQGVCILRAIERAAAAT